MPAKSKRIVPIIPIAPRIEQDRLLRIVALEWVIREEKDNIRHTLLAGATIAPAPAQASSSKARHLLIDRCGFLDRCGLGRRCASIAAGL